MLEQKSERKTELHFMIAYTIFPINTTALNKLCTETHQPIVDFRRLDNVKIK